MDVIQLFDGLFAMIAGRAAEITTTFQPVGLALVTSLATLAVVLFGAAIWFGTSEWLSGLLRMCAMCAGTAWAITAWPGLVQGTLAWVDRMVASAIPGWHGAGIGADPPARWWRFGRLRRAGELRRWWWFWERRGVRRAVKGTTKPPSPSICALTHRYAMLLAVPWRSII